MTTFTERVALAGLAIAWLTIGTAFYATIVTETRRQAEQRMREIFNRGLSWAGYFLLAVLWIGLVTLWVIKGGEPDTRPNRPTQFEVR